MNAKVKKVFVALFVLLCIGAIGYGGYTIYSGLNISPPEKETTTDPSANDPGILRVRIANLEESGFELFEENGALVLIHKGNETKFEWNGVFNAETVQMNFADYNNDGQNELAIVTTQTDKENQVVSNEVHILSVLENGTEITYRDTTVTSNSFRWNADIQLTAEQMANKKRVAITSNEKTTYVRTPAKEDGTYYNYESTAYGVSLFQLTPGSNEISATVELLAAFTDYPEKFVAGYIKSGLVYDGAQYIYKDSHFEPAEGMEVTVPAGNPEPFKLLIQNKDPKISTGLKLTSVEFTLEAGYTNTHDFEESQSEERYLTDIILTESYIELRVPTNMGFNDAIVMNYPPVVWMGGDDGFYMQAGTTIITESNYIALRTEFDEKISRDDFKKLVYRFGE